MIFRKVKNCAKKIPVIVLIYRFLNSIVLSFNTYLKSIRFINIGNKVIRTIHRLLDSSGYVFFVDMGTLLGIYRDGRLIKRDLDIDIGIQINCEEDILLIRNILITNGFKHKFIFKVENLGIIQDTFVFKGITIDFSYYKYDGIYDYCYMLYDTDDNKNLIIRMNCSHISKTIKYKYNHQFVNIPINAEAYLSDRYGTNWRIPDSKYKYWEGPSVIKITGKGICQKMF